MSTPSILHAPRREAPFKLYIDAKEKAIDVILTPEDKKKNNMSSPILLASS